MEKRLLRIYLGTAYRAGQNGSPERFLDDLADDFMKDESKYPDDFISEKEQETREEV